MAPAEALTVDLLVAAKRRGGGIVRMRGEGLREGGRADDGHAGALTEQRDAACGITDQDSPATRPGVQTYPADGVEVDVVARAEPFEQFRHPPPHVGVDIQ